VWEENGELVFLRKIVHGGVKKSFWLEVAKIAWLNNSVVSEARNMLKKLELEHGKVFWVQMSIWEPIWETKVEYVEKDSQIEKDLANIDIDKLAPIDALNLIVSLKNKL
jgi:DNA mismatch repair protein MutS